MSTLDIDITDTDQTVELPEKLKKQLELENIEFSEEQLIASSNGIYNKYVKRTMDFVLALIATVILIPFFVIISVAIVVETGLPILYRADRGGYKGKTFKINKFRTMVQNADKVGGGTTALNDSRITKIGAVLRKTKCDEIPQLFNILNGTMSFIGPRPELIKYISNYEGIERYILSVRPGITDYSSLTFINLDEIVGCQNADQVYEKYVLKRKNQLRIKYVSNVSFKIDVILFLKTILRVNRKAWRVLFLSKDKANKEDVKEVVKE